MSGGEGACLTPKMRYGISRSKQEWAIDISEYIHEKRVLNLLREGPSVDVIVIWRVEGVFC